MRRISYDKLMNFIRGNPVYEVRRMQIPLRYYFMHQARRRLRALRT
ncbi:hypothetical protein [Vulcanisaeta sp. JCM 14467]|nr:hypothetical protein [Vulcanisaeta sp. JCM 14467]